MTLIFNSNESTTIAPLVTVPEIITLEFKTIGDHSMLGLIQLKNIRDCIKDKHVTIKATECWYVCFKDNMDYLISLKPKSVKIEIYKFI